MMSRMDCYWCRGLGTWEAYRLHREFIKGWNAAVEDMRRQVGWRVKDMP